MDNLNILNNVNIKAERNRSRVIQINLSELIDFLETNKSSLKNRIEDVINRDKLNVYNLIKALLAVYGVSSRKLRNNYGNLNDFQNFVIYVEYGYNNVGFGLIKQNLVEIGEKILLLLTNTNDIELLNKYELEEIGYVALVLYFQY